MSQNIIPCQSVITIEQKKKIRNWINHNPGIQHAVEYLSGEFQIQITSDPDVVKGFERDSSNLPGNAEMLCRPTNDEECALILTYCQSAKIPVTIAAGRTNLNGSATPEGGMVISMEKNDCARTSIGFEYPMHFSPCRNLSGRYA